MKKFNYTSLFLLSSFTIISSNIQAADEVIDWKTPNLLSYRVMNDRTLSIEIDPTTAPRYIRYGYIQLMTKNPQNDDYYTMALSPKPNDFNVPKNCITQGQIISLKWSHEGRYAPKDRALNCDVSKTEKSYLNVMGKKCNNNSYCDFSVINYGSGQAGTIKTGDHNDIFSEQSPIQISSLTWGDSDVKESTVEQGKVISYRIDPKAAAKMDVKYGAVTVSKGNNSGNYKIALSSLPGDLKPKSSSCISQSGTSVNVRWSYDKSGGYCSLPKDEIFYINVTSDNCKFDNGCDFQLKNLFK